MRLILGAFLLLAASALSADPPFKNAEEALKALRATDKAGFDAGPWQTSASLAGLSQGS